MKKELSGLIALLGVVSGGVAKADVYSSDLPSNAVIITDSNGQVIRAIPIDGEVNALSIQEDGHTTIHTIDVISGGSTDNRWSIED